MMVTVWNEYGVLKNSFSNEYGILKGAFGTEYTTVKTGVGSFIADEVKSCKRLLQFQVLASLLPMVVGLLFGFIGCVGNVCGVSLKPQGFRSDTNKIAISLSGLISVCMLCLAPIFGVKKILNMCRPLLDLLKQVPYATWFCRFLKNWWNGDADFDDLPQTDDEVRRAFKHCDEADELAEELVSLRKATDRLSRSEPWKKTPKENLDPKGDKGKEKEKLSKSSEALKDPYYYSKTEKDAYDKAQRMLKMVKWGVYWVDDKFVIVNYVKAGKTMVKREEIITVLTATVKDGMIRFNGKPYPNAKECIDAMMNVYGATMKPDGSVVLDDPNERYKRYDYSSSHSTSSSSEEVISSSDEHESLEQQGRGSSIAKMNSEIRAEKERKRKNEAEEIARLVAIRNAEIAAEKTTFRKVFDAAWEKVRTKSHLDELDERLSKAKEKPKPEIYKGNRSLFRRAADSIVGWFASKVADEDSFINPQEIVDQACSDIDDCVKWFSDRKVYFFLFGILAASVIGGYKLSGETKMLTAGPQSRAAKAARTRRRRVNRGKFFQHSSGDEVTGEMWDEASRRERRIGQQSDDDDYDTGHFIDYEIQQELRADREWAEAEDRRQERMDRYYEREKNRERQRLHGQGKVLLPPSKPDDAARRAIYQAKHRNVQVSLAEMEKFVAQAKEAYSTNLKPQSFKPQQLAAGVYKMYVDDRYACTATHVGNRLYVVLHCLSENSETKYRAVNQTHVLEVNGYDLVVVNKEIGYFPVNGIPSPFKTKDFKILETANIVTVLGYGHGQCNEVDAVVGFASPLGWCNAATRDGDCTAPVLNCDGKIVGFWTHGNGKDFGRFEPITQEFLEIAKTDNISAAQHSGLVFRSSPPKSLN